MLSRCIQGSGCVGRPTPAPTGAAATGTAIACATSLMARSRSFQQIHIVETSETARALLRHNRSVTDTVSPQTDLPTIHFTQRTLPNGLRVIVAPDHLAPVVAIN